MPTLHTTGTSLVRVVGSLGPMCVLDTSATVQCFGTSNSKGLLTSALAPMFRGQPVASPRVWEWHTCGITSTGTPLCTGTAVTNNAADLGYGAMSDVATVQQLVATRSCF